MTLPLETQPVRARPRIYYVSPLLLSGLERWIEVLEHARALGFDAVMCGPVFQRKRGASIFSSEDFEAIDQALGLGEKLDDALSSLAALGRSRPRSHA